MVLKVVVMARTYLSDRWGEAARQQSIICVRVLHSLMSAYIIIVVVFTTSVLRLSQTDVKSSKNKGAEQYKMLSYRRDTALQGAL